MSHPNNNPPENRYSFVEKTWIVGSVFALITVTLLLFRATFGVLVLVLAGALVAVFFHGIADVIHGKIGVGKGWALVFSVMLVVLLAAGAFWLIGAKAQEQVSQLTESLPEMRQKVTEFLKHSDWGRRIGSRIQDSDSQKKALSFFAGFFQSTFGFLGNLYIILFIGVFFTASPELYSRGLRKLVPPRKRKRAEDLTTSLNSGLKRWLAGKLFAMLVVTVLTAVGLLILGVPMWLALAIIAGLLNFIPNFGPVLAAVPAALVALNIGPATAGIVVAMYVMIQVIESNFITPKVQQRLIEIPPALIIIAQVFVGTVAGVWGLLLATPMALILMITINKLYIVPMEEAAR